MAKTVIWNKTASRQLDELLTYLRDEVSERTASRFLKNYTTDLTCSPNILKPEGNHRKERPSDFTELTSIAICIIAYMGASCLSFLSSIRGSILIKIGIEKILVIELKETISYYQPCKISFKTLFARTA